MKNNLVRIITTAAALAFITAPVTSTLANAKSHKVDCYGAKGAKDKEVLKVSAKKRAKLGGSTTVPKN